MSADCAEFVSSICFTILIILLFLLSKE